MTRFVLRYDPFAGRACPCGDEIGCVFVELDDVARCASCVDSAGWPIESRMVEALDDLDSAMFQSADRARMAADALRIAFAITAARVPEGIAKPVLSDEEFVAELLRRDASKLDPDRLFELVGVLAPEMPSAAFRRVIEGALRTSAHHAAQGAADAESMSAAILLFPRVPEGLTLGQAVEHLGIDFDRFAGSVAAAAAQRGVPVSDLPPDLVNDIIASSKKDGTQ